MTIRTRLITASFVAIPIALAGQGQGIDPAQLLKPLADQWPTHNGDYSGKRYSALKQIDQTTVKNLTLAWVAQLNEGAGSAFGFDTIFGFTSKKSIKSVMNKAWSAMLENVEKTAWIFVLVPAIAPARKVRVPKLRPPLMVL